MSKNILAIDQGTTSSRAIIFSQAGAVLASSQYEFPQIFPADGWVEHDPEEIWQTSLRACKDVLDQCDGQVATVGITNQRETTVIWDRNTGVPIYNAIVWQDRRTANRCDNLKANGSTRTISDRTGLIIDAYFSATKIAWILDQVPGARKRAENGELAFGTVDCFLIWRLTNGKTHATDASNASRTLLFNIHTQNWDQELLDIFDVPAALLPEVRNCADDYGQIESNTIGLSLPIGGVVGDQQGALFGQACFEPGMVKSTYGTGCFLVMNTGQVAVTSKNQLLTTVGYRLNDQVCYALEGSIFNAGTAIQWLRDELHIIDHVDEIESLITSTESNQGVYMVPAFTGLGAPHWDPHARGAILGITRDTSSAILVRAALEAVCYQTRELVDAMMTDSGQDLTTIRVDGGMVANNWLLQFLANIIDTTVEKPEVIETTALGAAYLAGLHHGIYSSTEEIAALWQQSKQFKPHINVPQRQQLIDGWDAAIGRVKT